MRKDRNRAQEMGFPPHSKVKSPTNLLYHRLTQAPPGSHSTRVGRACWCGGLQWRMRAFITEMGDMPHSRDGYRRVPSGAIAQIAMTYRFVAGWLPTCTLLVVHGKEHAWASAFHTFQKAF